jgi:hypothetical protein
MMLENSVVRRIFGIKSVVCGEWNDRRMEKCIYIEELYNFILRLILLQ